MMGAYITGENKVRWCGVCGLEHAIGHHTPVTICVRELKAEVSRLQELWQAEHTEWVRLEERLKAAEAEIENILQVYKGE